MAKTEEVLRSDAPGTPVPWDWNRVLTPRVVLLILPLAALVILTYWHPMRRWEAIWHSSADWGFGYLIPVIAVLIAHYRLKELNPTGLRPSQWGLVFILGGLTLRIWAQMLRFAYPGEISFLPVVAGVILLVLGWRMLRAVGISVAYLGLMIPWEAKYYEGVALPLQLLSAAATEKILILFGAEVTRQGNVIHLPSGPITVAEACSGLHLLFAFVALGVMMAFIYRLPLWERILIMVSSVPIAVFCNMLRVTLMALASDHLFFEAKAAQEGQPTWSATLSSLVWHNAAGGDLASRLTTLRESVLNPESYLHQSFGFLMMGLALVILWAELKFIDMLFIEDDTAKGGDKSATAGR